MNSGFHGRNLRTNSHFTSYQRHLGGTTRGTLWRKLAGAIFLIAAVCSTVTLARGEVVGQHSQPHGFAPGGQNLFAPLLMLASREEPQRALEAFDRVLDLARKMDLYPALSPELQSLIDKLPPPAAIPPLAAELYARGDIPWRMRPPAVHYLTFDGRPGATRYLYSLSSDPTSPQADGELEGALALRPGSSSNPAAGGPQSVIANIKVSLYVGNMLPDQELAALAGFLREVFGTLEPPWDGTTGLFNDHDRAMLARLRRDMPALSGLIDHYVRIHNLIDEMTDSSAVSVLFNLDAEIRDEALAPFPHLRTFYRGVVEHIEANSVISDDQGRQWTRMGFERGRIKAAFMLREGRLAPMTAAPSPARDALTIDQVTRGHFTTDTSISAHGFGMTFGLAGIRFDTSYLHDENRFTFESRMDSVPRLIAPGIVDPIARLIAGQFMETLAKGNSGRGIVSSLAVSRDPRDGTLIAGTVSSELLYAPILGFLARLGNVIPQADAPVREEGRRLLEQFFDAFAADYNRARPILLGESKPDSRKH